MGRAARAGVPAHIVERILTIKDDRDWGDLPSEVRSVIGTAWAVRTDKHAVVITHVGDYIPKWKVREFITFTARAEV